jgi:hypothetical protein
MAGLELWVDPDDALAAAKFARLISYPEDEDRFISRVLKCPGYEAFSGLDEVETLRRARQARRVLRVLRALRALWVLRALRVRRVLRALWAALVPELAQARPLPRATLAPPLPVRWPGTSSETVCTAFWPLTGPTSAQRNASSLRSACCKGGRWKATSLPKA